jgi:hypothetical protein
MRSGRLLVALPAIMCLVLAATGRGEGDPPTRDIRRGGAALVSAARDGHLERVRQELARGAAPDARMGGQTALMNAALQGYGEIVRVLLEAGADPSLGLHTATSWSALEFAAMNGRLDAISLLLDRAPPPAQVQRVMFIAAEQGRPKTLERIVSAGADVRARREDGAHGIHLAAQRGHAQTIGTLVRMGADPNARDAKGRTPLMFASWVGERAAVDALLGAGADPDLEDEHGARAFGTGAVLQGAGAPTRVSHLHAEVKPDACPLLMGAAVAYPTSEGPAANAYGLPRRPEPSSEGWLVLPDVSPGLVSVQIGLVEPAEHPDGAWNAGLTPLGESQLALPAGRQASGLLLWPAGDIAPTRVEPGPHALPFGVLPESIRVAVDLDADRQPDLLELEYCCKAPWRTDACEYICGSYWQRSGPEPGDAWARCDVTQPE